MRPQVGGGQIGSGTGISSGGRLLQLLLMAEQLLDQLRVTLALGRRQSIEGFENLFHGAQRLHQRLGLPQLYHVGFH
ncbi:hypothetical protein D3C85_1603330 [compost metagenome]